MSNAKKNEGVPLSEAKARLSELVRLAQKEPQRIQVSGEPSGAIISEKDLQMLLELRRQRRTKLLRKFMTAAEEEGVYEEDFTDLRAPIKEVDLK